MINANSVIGQILECYRFIVSVIYTLYLADLPRVEKWFAIKILEGQFVLELTWSIR